MRNDEGGGRSSVATATAEPVDDLALHERSLIERTQIPQFQFQQARRSGQFDGRTTLAQVHRLATELGVSLAELLASPQPATAQEPATATTSGDVETLIPILVSTTNLVSVAHAARVLGWSRDHIDAVLAAIPAALDGTGLRLHHVKGRANIAWIDSQGNAMARTVGRLQTMTVGLNLTQAHTLRRITNGETIFQRHIGKEEKLTLFGHR
ncbi:MAG: hypothetical protein JWR62_990 [Modestobacter sp.]|nr:hypothetical protein [Modestobacter sp.]